MQSPSQGTGGPEGLRGEVRSDAERLSHSASNRLHSEIDARKGTAADQARSVSTAIDRAANELDEGAPQWLQSAFQQGAQQVRRFADTLEQKDSRRILNDVQDMARDNPGTFLLGCAAIGFAAARVLKAGAPESSTSQSRPTHAPPVSGEEPMFRSPGGEQARSASPAGEFV